MEVRARLNEEEEVLEGFINRRDTYMATYRKLLEDKLDLLEIETCKNAILLMEDSITEQKAVIRKIEAEQEMAIMRMNEAIQERKIHEKLKEKRFEEFLVELNQEEMKEIDELVSFTYNNNETEED